MDKDGETKISGTLRKRVWLLPWRRDVYVRLSAEALSWYTHEGGRQLGKHVLSVSTRARVERSVLVVREAGVECVTFASRYVKDLELSHIHI